MGWHGVAAVLLAAALAAAGCLRAHDPRSRTVPGEAPRGTAAAGETGIGAHRPAPATAAAPSEAPVMAGPAAVRLAVVVDFASQVQPILATRCQPCHFAGGKMYDKLPFDDPETIRHLGERLFTRINAEEERALIRAFLAQGAGGRAAVERKR